MKLPLLLPRSIFCAVATLCAIASPLFGQSVSPPPHTHFSPTIVVPQQKAYALDSATTPPQIIGVDAVVTIDNRTAVTELTVEIAHPFSSESNIAPDSQKQLTAATPFSLLVPIPERAVVRSTRTAGDMEGAYSQAEFSAPEALPEYQSAAREVDNPGLLEFIGTKLLRCGNFSIPPGGSGSFTIVYEESLKTSGNRVDYTLPRSESFAFRRTPWNITVNIASPKAIAGVHSPSHPITTDQPSPTQAVVNAQALSIEGTGPRLVVGSISNDDAGKRSGRKYLDPGSFRLSWMTGNELSASFFAYPSKQSEGGSFTMLVGTPPLKGSENRHIRREIILVIDRSGSMRGEKIEQVRLAAQTILEELNDGEAFNIVDYADSVRQYSPTPVLKNAETLQKATEYVGEIVVNGGTNIHDALLTALSQKPTRGYLPLVIFLTDGTPTIGITQEALIRRGVVKANVYNRRIFTFGVGYDVNAPLLDAIAGESKATTTFALPFDNIGAKITELFRRLNGPVFSDIELNITTPDGADASHTTSDVLPRQINDLFDGDRLILAGNYLKNDPLTFTLRGNYLGAERTFSFTLDPVRDQDSNAPWVYRLWAQRKITDDVVRIAQAGAIPEKERTEGAETELRDLTGEIVRLSTDNGIVTEYTDFLANPSVNVQDMSELERMAKENLRVRAQNKRTGKGAINQALNNNFAMRNGADNRANVRLNENLQIVEITSVQQIHDLTFFHRTCYWENTPAVDTTTREIVSLSVTQNDLIEHTETLEEKYQRLSRRKTAPLVEPSEPARAHFAKRWVDARILDSAGTQHPDRTVRFGTEEYNRFIGELMSVGRQGVLALEGDILLLHKGEIVLITGGGKATLE